MLTRKIRHRRFVAAMTLTTALALSACGYNQGGRAVSGGLLGAGAGAAIGAVTGGSPLTGALIGGAAGAVGGAATSGNNINLGKPVWQ